MAPVASNGFEKVGLVKASGGYKSPLREPGCFDSSMIPGLLKISRKDTSIVAAVMSLRMRTQPVVSHIRPTLGAASLTDSMVTVFLKISTMQSASSSYVGNMTSIQSPYCLGGDTWLTNWQERLSQ